MSVEIQGRKWLSKSGGWGGGASSNMAAMAARHPEAAPSILPKGGVAIAPPAPPTVMPLNSKDGALSKRDQPHFSSASDCVYNTQSCSVYRIGVIEK